MFGRLVSTSAVLALALGIAGCAATPKGIGKGEPVAFVEEPPRDERPMVELRNAAIGASAKTGTGTGMLVGAVAGLGCGLGAIICSPVLAVMGGLGGAVLGAGVGVAQGLPDDVQAQLQRRVDTFVRSHDVRAALMTAIVERGQGHWVPVMMSSSAPAVRVRVDHVSLYSDQAGRVGLAIRVVVVAPLADDRHGDIEKAFEYIGVSSEPRLWIEDPDGFVLASFRQGYAQVAHSVFAYLAR